MIDYSWIFSCFTDYIENEVDRLNEENQTVNLNEHKLINENEEQERERESERKRKKTRIREKKWGYKLKKTIDNNYNFHEGRPN